VVQRGIRGAETRVRDGRGTRATPRSCRVHASNPLLLTSCRIAIMEITQAQEDRHRGPSTSLVLPRFHDHIGSSLFRSYSYTACGSLPACAQPWSQVVLRLECICQDRSVLALG